MDRTDISIELREDGAHVFVHSGRRGVGKVAVCAGPVALGDVPGTLDEVVVKAKEKLDAKERAAAEAA